MRADAGHSASTRAALAAAAAVAATIRHALTARAPRPEAEGCLSRDDSPRKVEQEQEQEQEVWVQWAVGQWGSGAPAVI